MADGAGTVEWSPAVLHVDMDAFFAAVEVLHNPELRGKPVIVGGTGRRGVVASCTYEARVFGVRSAMPTMQARQLCPNAVFVDGHYTLYVEISGKLHDLMRDVTPLVEPIGLDEAFLDVTGARRLLGDPVTIAHALRGRVADELSLDCSIGVGRSKLVAKLASRAAKPRIEEGQLAPGAGVFAVAPQDELAFLHPMPVQALWGVGPATTQRLRGLGVRTVGDLAALPEDTVLRRLGRAHGSHLIALSHGHDPAPVVADRPAKSIGHEETFARDERDGGALQRHAVRMSQSVAENLRKSELTARTVSIKVRFADFTTITRSHTLTTGVDTPAAIAAVAGALLDGVDPSPGIRLFGVSVSSMQAQQTESHQMAFNLAAVDGNRSREDESAGASGARAVRLQSSWEEIIAAVDAIRARYGRESVGSAAMVSREGLHVPTRRESPWGPAAEPPQNTKGETPGD